ncbi:MAG: hypothetical protein QXF55_00520 [Candidatus Aenigmatarchaeota archaeon]
MSDYETAATYSCECGRIRDMSQIVSIAQSYPDHNISITFGGRQFDAKNIFEMCELLCCGINGKAVTIRVSGEKSGCEKAAEEIKHYLEEGWKRI